jgi:hypothetical protein
MSDAWGMDPNEVGELAKQWQAQADVLASIWYAIDHLTSQMAQAWEGTDSEAWLGEWQQTHGPALLGAHDRVSSLADTLVQNVVEQERASAADGSEVVGGSNVPSSNRSEVIPGDPSPFAHNVHSSFVDMVGEVFKSVLRSQTFDKFDFSVGTADAVLGLTKFYRSARVGSEVEVAPPAWEAGSDAEGFLGDIGAILWPDGDHPDWERGAGLVNATAKMYNTSGKISERIRSSREADSSGTATDQAPADGAVDSTVAEAGTGAAETGGVVETTLDVDAAATAAFPEGPGEVVDLLSGAFLTGYYAWNHPEEALHLAEFVEFGPNYLVYEERGNIEHAVAWSGDELHSAANDSASAVTNAAKWVGGETRSVADSGAQAVADVAENDVSEIGSAASTASNGAAKLARVIGL